jgi:hypothetical protein
MRHVGSETARRRQITGLLGGNAVQFGQDLTFHRKLLFSFLVWLILPPFKMMAMFFRNVVFPLNAIATEDTGPLRTSDPTSGPWFGSNSVKGRGSRRHIVAVLRRGADSTVLK